ncbi:MAG: heme-binding protein [Myxococcota bacterium]
MSRIVFLAFMLCPAVAFAEAAYDLPVSVAVRGISACESMAKKKGWRVAIAVKDIGGNLVAFRRMDGAFTMATSVALQKAESAATTPLSTAAMRELVYRSPERPHGLEFMPGVAVFDGGEPIRLADGTQIGAIGVSGATSKDDGRCARHAVAEIGRALGLKPQ